MKSKNHQWEEMIFESRNKAYGAYELRVNYESRLGKAMMYVLAGMLTTFVFAKWIMAKEVVPAREHHKEVLTLIDFSFEQPEIVPPTPPQPPAQHTRTVPPPPVPIADPNIFKPVVGPLPVVPLVPVNPPAIPIEPGTGSGPSGPLEKPGTTGLPATGAMGIPVMGMAVVDKAPEFPGGLEKFYQYLKNNLKYPMEAKEIGVSGRLYVYFVVSEQGEITSIEFKNKVGYGMEKAVANVLESSPKWAPGVYKNEHVPTSMVIPISFNLLK